jgi:recombination protein RecA
MYGEGISKEGDILDLASENNILEKSGSWFAWKGERIGQGRENAKEFLKQNPAVATEIERAVLEKMGISRAGDPVVVAASAVEPAPANGSSGSGKRSKEQTARA